MIPDLTTGDHHQIDMSPDHYWQMLRCDTDMYDVEHLLVGDLWVTLEVADNVQLRVQKNTVGSLMPKGTIKSA